jgi:hypothetical protein
MVMNMPNRKLKIDMMSLELVFDSNLEEASEFLDLRTGEIVIVESLTEEADDYQANENYLPIPHQDIRDSYGDMQQFVETVSDPRLEELLSIAIQGKGAFRRFKDSIAQHPEAQERWFSFKEQRLQERIKEWLESNDIEAI